MHGPGGALAAAGSGPAPAPRACTVFAAFEAYLAAREGRVLPHTYRNAKYYLEEFAAAFGPRPVASLIPHDLTAWLARHERRWPSPDTRAFVVRQVRAALGWAAAQGLAAANPFARVTAAMTGRRRPVAPEDYRRLLAAFAGRPRLAEALRFLVLTGCRPSEMARLRWDQLDLGRGVAVLPAHKTSHSQKVKRPRVVVAEALALRAAVRARGAHPEYVFVSERGRPWYPGLVQRKVRAKCLELGVPVVYSYGLRHSYGTEAVRAGVPLKAVSELMGHSSVRTTEVYVHLAGDVEYLRAAAERVRPAPASGAAGGSAGHVGEAGQRVDAGDEGVG